MARRDLIAAAVAALILPSVAHAATMADFPIAVLQTLDKVTARVSTIEVPVGRSAEFGRMSILVRACRKTPPEERPESAAFLEVAEEKLDGGGIEQVFSGWMFASSPSLSAMEHPVYDVWVVDCAREFSKEAAIPVPERKPERPADTDTADASD